MVRKTAVLPAIFACMLMVGLVVDALAGEVKLVSDTLDEICRVEITWGPAAPEGTAVQQFLDVKKNWSITKPDRLCYRRSSTPDNCESGMTQWNTQWKCAANDGSGQKELSLQ